MSEIGNNVYLILEIVKSDKSGVAYNLFMRASKPFNQFIKAHQSIGAEIRDSVLEYNEHPCLCDGRARTWWFRGVLHRIDGPARQHLCQNGWEEWYYEGNIHRVGGAATTDKFKMQWVQNNVLHREDGPAKVYLDWGGPDPSKVRSSHYYIKGARYSNRNAYYARHIPRRPPSERIKNRQNPY